MERAQPKPGESGTVDRATMLEELAKLDQAALRRAYDVQRAAEARQRREAREGERERKRAARELARREAARAELERDAALELELKRRELTLDPMQRFRLALELDALLTEDVDELREHKLELRGILEAGFDDTPAAHSARNLLELLEQHVDELLELRGASSS